MNKIYYYVYFFAKKKQHPTTSGVAFMVVWLNIFCGDAVEFLGELTLGRRGEGVPYPSEASRSATTKLLPPTNTKSSAQLSFRAAW